MSGLNRLFSVISVIGLVSLPCMASAAEKWATPGFAAGWKNYANGYRPLSAVKSGDVVTVSGLVARSGGQWGHIATLPADMRPRKRLIFNVNTHDRTSRVDVLTNGQIHFITGQTGYNWVSLDGISFVTGKTYPLPLTPGWQNYGGGYAAANELKVGNTVTLSGLVKPGAGNVIATLPNHLRPAKRHIFNVNSHDKTSRVDVLPNGQVIWVHRAPARGWVSLDGIRFEQKPGQPLQLVNGWSNYQDGYATATATRIGNRISINGLLRAGRWGHMATLPKGMCPEQRLIFNANNHNRSSRVDIWPDCRIVWAAGGRDHGWVSLEGLSFVQKTGGGSAAAPKTATVKLPWKRVSGQAIDISVSAKGQAWVVGSNGSAYRWDGRTWVNAGGRGITRIAAGPNGAVWVVANGTQLWRYDGRSWQNQNRAARDVSVSAEGTVWILGNRKGPGGYDIWHNRKGRWQRIGGTGVAIAADPKGDA